MSYGDSGWANAEQFKRQTGYLVTFTSSLVVEESALATVMARRSSRTKQVVRSTLAVKACAADDVVDMGYYVPSLMPELLTTAAATTGKGVLPVRLYKVTDCRSLYDCILKESPSISEKTTTIDILSIHESLTGGSIRWVPTDMMWADGFTNMDKKLRSQFTSLLDNSVVALHD